MEKSATSDIQMTHISNAEFNVSIIKPFLILTHKEIFSCLLWWMLSLIY